MEKRKKKKLVIGVTGSIAAFKTAELVSQLSRKNFQVTVVMTKAAQKFIRPLTFQALSNRPVIIDLFSSKKNWDINHISLAEQANLIIIAPASANIIGKIAGGMADDFLSTLIISASSPVLICPAMNGKMYKNSLVQENIKKLKKAGFRFLGPEKGRLACGDEGLGRLVEIRKIILEISKILKLPTKSKHV